MSEDIFIFDRTLSRIRKERLSKKFKSYDFLFRYGAEQIADRLSDINRSFENTLQIGSRGIIHRHQKIKSCFITDNISKPLDTCHFPYIQSDEEFLPFAENSFDLILSNLNLHTINDLPGTLVQIRRALKPDGLFIAALFGGETLHELRQVLQKTELELKNGISPRVSPFTDKPEAANLLQRAGFTLPVVDSEIITVTYDNIFKLMHDLRGMGETNTIIARDRSFTGKDFFISTALEYKRGFSENDKIIASFEIIFLIGWADHQSQQKPLRPGCAKISLAEALGAEEIKTGDYAKP